MRSDRLAWLFWLGAVGYVVLTVLAATHVVDSLDYSVFRLADRHQHPALVAAASHLTDDVFTPVTDIACLALGAGVLAWHRRRPAVFVAAALSAATMAVVVVSTKVALGRPLPHTRPDGHADAFPSGHTATFLVCFGTLVLLATTRQRYWRGPLLAIVGVGALLVAAALVYDGFHWLTDTIASVILGVSVLSGLALAGGAGRRPQPPVPR